MEQVAKPLIMEIDEAKTETLNAVNNILKKHNLPCYLYENIIADVHQQISSLAKNELNTVRQDYVKQLEANKEVEEGKDESNN